MDRAAGVRYFAYGSNLDIAQMRARCPSSNAGEPAYLEGFTLAFAGHSARRNGAVATLVEALGRVAAGRLFTIDEPDLAQLDAYEGVPTSYVRERHVVRRANDLEIEAWVYRKPQHEREQPPAPDYVRQIRRAYRDLDMPIEHLEYALERNFAEVSGSVTTSRPHRLFVYGTLMRGEPNHHYLESASYLGMAITAPIYELVHLGSYPALLPDGRRSVLGEVYAVDDRTRAAIDELEGHPRAYRRVDLSLRGEVYAEGYLMRHAKYRRFPMIASGDWRSLDETPPARAPR